MRITCWGSRGSIPVSGAEYLIYGGDTTCMEIRTQSDDIIIVDAGTGIRRLGNQLMAEKRQEVHFLFTHAHWDHLMGFPFFKPLYSAQSRFWMYRCPFGDQFVENMLTRVMSPPHFPVNYTDIQARISYADACPTDFRIGSVSIVPIRLNHPNSGSGYKFIENGRTFVFLTDNELNYTHPLGLSRDHYLDFCHKADLLIHDAEYTPQEYTRTIAWGHSTYIDALDLAIAAGVRRLGLFHINQERTDEQMNHILSLAHATIAQRTATLECVAVGANMVFEV